VDRFERFLNMLINDTTWCIEESFIKLQEIKKYEILDQTQIHSEKEQKKHEKTRGYCRFSLRQTNESIWILSTLTKFSKQIFLSSSFVDRIAVMLNYFISSLVGPTCLEIKVI
jgi:hypothetical protein